MQQAKAALVTGGSRGIGAAIVERLARDGAAVAFTYAASEAAAQALAARVEASGGRVLAIRADSADEAQLRAAVNRTVEAFGSLDILVNSAGVLEMGPVESFPVAQLDRSFNINVRGAFIAIQEALRHMQPGGRIVTIGSMAAVRAGFANSSVYAMTKGALASMVRGIAIDIGRRGITINNVQPGPVNTDMNPETSDFATSLHGLMAIPRHGRPEEIAGMVAYVASPEAAFVTGSSLHIDGGFAA